MVTINNNNKREEDAKITQSRQKKRKRKKVSKDLELQLEEQHGSHANDWYVARKGSLKYHSHQAPCKDVQVVPKAKRMRHCHFPNKRKIKNKIWFNFLDQKKIFSRFQKTCATWVSKTIIPVCKLDDLRLDRILLVFKKEIKIWLVDFWTWIQRSVLEAHSKVVNGQG